MKPVRIGLMGFGVVGSGTLELLRKHKKAVEVRVGAPVEVAWVCSHSRKESPFIDSTTKQTKRWQDVVADPTVDCIVELFGGTEPARPLILNALQTGKHVVTANKAVLSKHWNEVFGLANEKHKLVYFEAAVGGGVPVIQALNEGLAGNEITKILGILNGTTNYILTKMQEENMPYKEALAQAQQAGFAEANPSFDVNGIDAAQKISILGSLAAGSWVSPSQVHTEGISTLTLGDMHIIKNRLDSVVKLLGKAEITKNGWVFSVAPTVISKTHPFANVRNEYNAILLRGNAAGDVMLYGKGAGRLPTSSAVLSDIIFLCRQIANETAGELPYVLNQKKTTVKMGQLADLRKRFYLHITTKDRPGVLSQITGILGRHGVSIASIHQDAAEALTKKKEVSVVLVTHENLEKSVQSAVQEINTLRSTTRKTILLRIQ